jgi:hypothetical protein
VPDNLWAHATSGKGKKYSDNQSENVIKDDAFMQTFNNWVNEFETFVTKKGKVTPGKWRAYGFKPPTNLWKEFKTGIRSWMLRFGIAPEHSSPEVQKKLALNKDTTLRPSISEGEKLRNQ